MPALQGAAAADKPIGGLTLGLETSQCGLVTSAVQPLYQYKYDVANDLSARERPPAPAALPRVAAAAQSAGCPRGELLAKPPGGHRMPQSQKEAPQ